MAKIMLVEDSSMQRVAIKSFLQADNHEVEAFENFDKASLELDLVNPEIFVLDIETTGSLTVMGFVDLIKSKKPKTPIIVLSGRIKKAMEELLLEKGVNLLLWKPIREADIQEKVRDQLK